MAPEDYIRSLFKPRDRVALVAIPRGEGGGDVLQVVRSAEVLAAERTQAWLRCLNAQRHDLFLGVNPVRPGAWGRTKAAIGEVMRVYLDIDDDGERALARIRADAGAGRLPPPTHVLRSSPGRFQVLWSVPRGALDHRRAEELTKGLAARYGADTQVIDVARVLRIPGYRNWKRGGAPCALVASTGRLAQLGEFPDDLPAPAPGVRAARPARDPGPSTGGDRSPSGRDGRGCAASCARGAIPTRWWPSWPPAGVTSPNRWPTLEGRSSGLPARCGPGGRVALRPPRT